MLACKPGSAFFTHALPERFKIPGTVPESEGLALPARESDTYGLRSLEVESPLGSLEEEA